MSDTSADTSADTGADTPADTTVAEADRSELAAFLSDRDVPCPSCGQNLRGLESPSCPSCGLGLSAASLRASASMASPRIVLAIRILSLGALAVALYLAYAGLTAQLPAGCGEGGGCDSVLTSRWSKIGGLPVSVPAAGVYLLVFIGSFFIGPHRADHNRREFWQVLLVCAVFIAGGALWFLILQAFVLKAFCFYCTMDHALGLATAGLIFARAPIRRGERLESGEESTLTVGPQRGGVMIAMSAAVVALFITSQVVFGPSGSSIEQTQYTGDGDGNGFNLADATPAPPGMKDDPSRFMIMLPNGPPPRGHVLIARDSRPVLGPRDAEHVFFCHVDYTCPHCRRLHQWFSEARKRWGDKVAFMIAPTPLNPDCNAHFRSFVERHAHACTLAKLALAVWRAEPDKFEQFDAWLFEPDEARNPQEARAEAERLVGAAALENAMQNETVATMIRGNTDLWKMATFPGLRSVPLMISGEYIVRISGGTDGLFDDIAGAFDDLE